MQSVTLTSLPLQTLVFLLCIERVKEFCKSQGYNNVVFLEMGKIILLAIKVSRKWMEEKERLPLIDW